MPRFRAKILKIGINPYVDVPDHISIFFKRRGYVPVTVRIGSGEVRTTLVPIGEGRHRLYMNGEMRRLASVDVGDITSLAVTLDVKPRIQRMPSLLRKELAKGTLESRAWHELTLSRRLEILRYLNNAKRPATLERNVSKVVSMLRSAQARQEKKRGHSTHLV